MKMTTSSWKKPAETEAYEPNVTLIRAGVVGLVLAVAINGTILFLTTRILSNEEIIGWRLDWRSSYGLATIYVIGRGFDRVFFKTE